jgi:type II secretory ATPase GspE/PulE/Tfp pilus assembly ATPase PilB-like protein
VETPAQELAKRKQLQDLSTLIGGAHSLDELVVGAPAERICDFFGADRATIYVVDTKNNHLVSIAKTGNELKEIRVERQAFSIAGFVGTTLRPVAIADVYNGTELARIAPTLRFDDRWDKHTGYKTKSVLCVPVMYDKHLLGVLQVINRKDGTPFGPRDLAYGDEVAKRLGLAFFNFNRIKTIAQPKKTKWDFLVESGAISIDALTKALVEAASAGADQARYLLDRANVKRADLDKALAHHFNTQAYKFNGDETIPDDLKAMVRNIDYLRQICAVPLEHQGTGITIVIDDPFDLARTDAIRRIYSDRGLVTLWVGLRDEILTCIDRSSGQRGEVGSLLRGIAAEKSGAADEEEDEKDADNAQAASDNSLIKLVDQLIIDAYNQRASDIHVEPYGREGKMEIRFRVDGDLKKYADYPPSVRSAVVARIKILAKLDIAEKRKPQDGKIKFNLDANHAIELRVATIPTVNSNEDVVMRILAASKPLPLEKMGMSEHNLVELKKLMNKPYGLVLCVGPTGSGKTTTLHSALGYINTVDMKIWTAEDPVEITQHGLRQVQVQPKIGFTFEAAMRAFLRADPDVIMVGEMRDKETAGTGIEASLTGHLVVSTLHTNSAPETITRLLDMDLDPFSFADALLGILAQRLTRGLCPECKVAYTPTPEELETIVGAFTEDQLKVRGWDPATLQLWQGRGCDTCLKTGYKGRIGLHELLVNDDEIKRSIVRKGAVEEIRKLAIENGMTTLLQDGIEKAVRGVTDLKQVLAVCSR